jgi:hypothetical protein
MEKKMKHALMTVALVVVALVLYHMVVAPAIARIRS